MAAPGMDAVAELETASDVARRAVAPFSKVMAFWRNGRRQCPRAGRHGRGPLPW